MAENMEMRKENIQKVRGILAGNKISELLASTSKAEKEVKKTSRRDLLKKLQK